MSGSEEDEYVDALGVITALEKTCELEAKLRQAIQDTHPLTTTLDWDFHAADREREALLAISEQLEYLEDKLREYRFLEPTDMDNKAVLLGQLDSVRRELVEVVDRFAPHVLFGKDAVREVLAFAQVTDVGEEGGEELGEGEEEGLEGVEGEEGLEQGSRAASGSQGGFASEIEALLDEEDGAAAAARRWTERGHAERAEQGQREPHDGEQKQALIPAVRRGPGGLQRPPRYPAGGAKETAAYGRHGGAPHASPKQAGVAQAGPPASPTSLHQQHQQQLAAMHGASPGRSAFLQAQQAQHTQRRPSGAHPLAARAVPGASGRQGRRQLDVDAADRGPRAGGRPGADTYSFSQAPAASAPAAVASYPPSSYAPSSYAPSDGAPSSRPSPQPSAAAGAAPPAAAAAPPAGGPAATRTFLLTRLNRAQEGGRRRSSDSAASSRYGVYSLVSDEDIYGALDDRGGGRPASITNPSPRQFGGFVKIKDRLGGAEEGAQRVPGPRSPVPPRIYGDGVREGDGWEGDGEVQPAAHAASVSLDAPALPRPGRYSEPRPARTAPARAPSPPGERHPYSGGGGGMAGRAQHSTARGGAEAPRPPGGDAAGPGLVGRLTNLLLTGAAATALVVVAQHAGPAVVQRGQLVGQQVARKVQEGQQQLAARRAAAKQRRREEEAAARREAARAAAAAAAPALPWQQGGRSGASPPRAAGSRMADLPPRPSASRAGAEPPAQQRVPGQGGRMADLPPHRQPGRGADVRPQPAPTKHHPSAAADPLPPFLAAAAAARVAGGAGGGAGPRVYGPQPGQLFPAMPPPDVSASMG